MTSNRHRTGQQHAARLPVQRHRQRAFRALTLGRDHADPGQQPLVHRSGRVHREHGGIRARRRLAPGRLKGQRRPQAERLHHPGQHGRQRTDRGVVPQDLRHGEVEHAGRGLTPPLTSRRPHEGHPKTRKATFT
jgi:hypothetical protein